MAPLLILNFRLPPMDEDTFFQDHVADNLAAIFGLDRSKIRRVSITRAIDSS